MRWLFSRLLSDFLSRNNWFPILLDSGLEDTTAITHTFFWDFPLSDEKREEIRKNLLLMAIVQVKKPPFSTEIQVIHNNQTAVKPGISYVVIGDPALIPSKNVQGVV